MRAPPERLGSFYLGAEYDLGKKRMLDNVINYDARDLTTHAVCVGMTGSGKTGLCVGLLEEAALDRVPAILIDPKGDITNMLLQFPDLQAKDFSPWINPDDARRKGKTSEEYSKYISGLWRNGLEEWGIKPERIKLLKDSADFTIYTPGSEAGLPISILSSLDAPDIEFNDNVEIIRERINGTVTALLGLLGIDADPIRSREVILLSNIFQYFWSRNENLDLTKLITSIQNPPVRKLGVFDVDTFYPEKDRFNLAMAFNSLIASPSFQSWLQGDPLNIDRMLYTDEGKPRHSIFYIAHLSDKERMFFLTLLLGNMVTWVRRQSGTTSLRALLYFDEAFGFFPPVAEPPSKRPLLTLLKQARAFGLGVVLVTQNPVDIDYKGLTNAGTWFIGKLQTERDKDRVLEGLKGAISASGGGNAAGDYDTMISKLSSRIFLMHNVHQDQPVVFYTRWVMSYLRGPLTRPQVQQLMKEKKERLKQIKHFQEKIRAEVPATQLYPDYTEAISPTLEYSKTQPILDPLVNQIFLPIKLNDIQVLQQISQKVGQEVDVKETQLIYEPMILGEASVRFMDRKRKIDEIVQKTLLASISQDLTKINWENTERDLQPDDLMKSPVYTRSDKRPFFASIPEKANSAKELKRIGDDLEEWLYYHSLLRMRVHKDLDIFQLSGESSRDFTIRIQQAAREQRDAEVDILEKKYEKSFDKLDKKLSKLGRDLTSDEAEYEARKREEMLGIGGEVLGFFMGKRRTSAGTTIARRRRMTAKAKRSIEETKEEISELKEAMTKLENELKEAVDEITSKWNLTIEDLTIEEVKPRRSDIHIQLVALAWLPLWQITYNYHGGQRKETISAYPLKENI